MQGIAQSWVKYKMVSNTNAGFAIFENIPWVAIQQTGAVKRLKVFESKTMIHLSQDWSSIPRDSLYGGEELV